MKRAAAEAKVAALPVSPCPACGSPSTYDRKLDRYLHADDSDNRQCWADLSSGRIGAA